LISAVSPYELYGGHKWTSTTRPTSEFWFDPWIADLKSRGVDIRIGHKLENVQYKDGYITSCTVNWKKVIADKYIMAMSPYHAYEAVKHIDSDHVRTLGELASHEPTTEISFQIGFDIQLSYEEKTSVMSFPDSDFNLTVSDQSLFWKGKDMGETKSLWSCVACNVPDTTITSDQFIQKCTDYMFNNKALQKMVGVEDLRKHVIWIKPWHTWDFDQKGEVPVNKNPHWVNTTKAHKHRLTQKTSVENLIFCGAHTKTDTPIYSMESACESGRRAARVVDESCSVLETNQYKFYWLVIAIGLGLVVIAILSLVAVYWTRS
jgi:hypothetical protein